MTNNQVTFHPDQTFAAIVQHPRMKVIRVDHAEICREHETRFNDAALDAQRFVKSLGTVPVALLRALDGQDGRALPRFEVTYIAHCATCQQGLRKGCAGIQGCSRSKETCGHACGWVMDEHVRDLERMINEGVEVIVREAGKRWREEMRAEVQEIWAQYLAVFRSSA